jgi:hypothetical protein
VSKADGQQIPTVDPLTYIVNTALGVLGRGRNSPGPGQRAALTSAGFTPVDGPGKFGRPSQMWQTPDGRILSGAQAAVAGRQINRAIRQGVNVGTRPPSTGTTGTSSSTPPVVYQPPPPPPWNPAPLPRGPVPSTDGVGVPPVVGVIDINKILEQLQKYNDILTGGIWSGVFGPKPIPKGPKTRPVKVPPGREDPFPAKGPPPVKVIVNNYPAPVPKGPSAAEIRRRRMEGLGDIFVSKRRMPIPTMPAPPKPLWMQLIPLVGPALLPFLKPDQGNKNVIRLTDPLTQPQSGLTSSTSTMLSYGSAFGGTPGQVGTNTCECKAPRKKGRKKKRTTCYSGTYIERADGTRKTKKRKVPCK